MGVINEEVIGGLHIAIDNDAQVVPFAQGTPYSLSGRLLLDTTDHTTFDALHFKSVVLNVGDWTAIPTDTCTRRRLLKSRQKKQKTLAASFGAWVISGEQFAMKFTVDLPPKCLAQMCRPSNWKKDRHGLIGIEVAAEVRVGRIGRPNDVAWRQQDKMVWMPPMDGEPRVRISPLVCPLF